MPKITNKCAKVEPFSPDTEFDLANDCSAIKSDRADSDTFDYATQIKQEDTVSSNELGQIPSDLPSRDFYYHCSECKEEMPDLESVYQHRAAVHGAKTPRTTRIKHMDLTPDVFDPNFYCRACEVSQISALRFRNHLRRVHHMMLLNSMRRPRPKNDSIPDPNDPDLYCRACEAYFSQLHRYRSHLAHVHKMKMGKLGHYKRIKNPDLLPEWHNPYNHCRSCETTYANKVSFYNHCRRIHKMELLRVKPATKDNDPDKPTSDCKNCNVKFLNKTTLGDNFVCSHRTSKTVDEKFNETEILDLGYYCQACKKSFTSQGRYHFHLQDVHRILDKSLLPTKRTKIHPIDDCRSKIHCYICSKAFATEGHYKRHLLVVHPKSKAQDEQPDVNDPNFHCRVCKRTYHSKGGYRWHLQSIHCLKLKPINETKFRDPSLLPDPLDPNYSCRVCKIDYKTAGQFRLHCKTIHEMVLEPFPNPDAEIDLASPELYCARCDKLSKTRQTFLQHLRKVHQLHPKTNRTKGIVKQEPKTNRKAILLKLESVDPLLKQEPTDDTYKLQQHRRS